MARTDLGLTVLLLAALSGCSLLVQDVPLPACTTDDECAALNATPGEKLITGCRRYQCTGGVGNPGTCVYRPLDADDDGHISAMCPSGDDCDDSRPSIFEGHAEVCDGLDNDCDLVIDDGNLGASPPSIEFETTGAAELTWGTEGSGAYRDTNTTFTFARTAEGVLQPALPLVVDANDVAGRAKLLEDGVQPQAARRKVAWLSGPSCADSAECPQPVCDRVPEPPDGGFWVLGTCGSVDGGFAYPCRIDRDCGWVCASERCVPPAREDVEVSEAKLHEVAISPIGGDGAFAVGVDLDGCSAGRLRVGWLDTRGHLATFGPEARSNVWLGVDVGALLVPVDGGGVTGPLSCSGAERGVGGATRPAVAALSVDGSPQALTVYLGDARWRDRCGDAVAVPVQGLGLFREEGPGVIRAWVTGSNDGHPETFGETNGGGAPAVAAVGELGWVVGYPEATTEATTPLALHFVGLLARPVPFDALLPDGGGPAPAYVRRSTAAFGPEAPFLELPTGGRADDVSIAVGAVHGTTYDLGVTWMEDCTNAGGESVWFSLVRFDPMTPASATATAPVQLSSGMAPGGYPAVLYAGADHPFVLAGWARNSGAPVAPNARGGFVVAWAGSGVSAPNSAVYAVRVSEADGLPVDAAPQQLRPTSDAISAGSVTLYATPGASGGQVSYSYWDNGFQVGSGHLICPAR